MGITLGFATSAKNVKKSKGQGRKGTLFVSHDANPKKTDEIREQMDKGARVRAQGRKGTLSNRTESKKL